ncbi:Sperm motility kinase Y [Zancudomyces culisetae]|uniref:Sperm motility kinase Y n=1 Tax=Zancudomyces culisetae TaxID=1213189 RepID=A0A1R1PR14_ZANCU|nr:Sperm motility kinase Y [Zancudomyces culisetae]|eukprot:OMH83407.1 Sperm motility kinase Y [Zancudomyces culisetae]
MSTLNKADLRSRTEEHIGMCTERNVMSNGLEYLANKNENGRCGKVVFELSSENLLGRGRISSVYRGRLYQENCNISVENLNKERYIDCAVKLVDINDEDAVELGILEACTLDYLKKAMDAEDLAGVVEYYGIAVFDHSLSEKELKSIQEGVGQLDTSRKGDLEYELVFMDTKPSPSDIKTMLGAGVRWAIVLKLYENGNTWSWSFKNSELMGAALFENWSKKLLNTLNKIHSLGVINNDIKPHNIMVTDNHGIRIGDFSTVVYSGDLLEQIEKVYGFSPKKLLAYGDMPGTIPYSAPELFGREYNVKTLSKVRLSTKSDDGTNKLVRTFGNSDLFSAGVTLFCLFISGKEPYHLIRNNVELLILAKKGKFLDWEMSHLTSRASLKKYSEPVLNQKSSFDSFQSGLSIDNDTLPTAKRDSCSTFNRASGEYSAEVASRKLVLHSSSETINSVLDSVPCTPKSPSPTNSKNQCPQLSYLDGSPVSESAYQLIKLLTSTDISARRL